MAKGYWINVFHSVKDPEKLEAYRKPEDPAVVAQRHADVAQVMSDVARLQAAFVSGAELLRQGPEQFMGKLAGVSDPEAKRKIIGKEFVEVFQAEAGKLKVDPNLLIALFVPIAALSIWWTVRSIRKKHVPDVD